MTDDDRYKWLLRQAQPPSAQHKAYVEQVADILHVLRSSRLPVVVSPGIATAAVVAPRRSRLFKRTYYVAWLPDDAFHALFGPTLDAVADPGAPEYVVPRPALVYAPGSMRSNRSPRFTSILEHEFIHINQALRDPSVMLVKRVPSGPQLLGDLLGTTHHEFCANYIQGHRWPEAHADSLNRLSISRTRWCLIRGYTSALETLLSNLLLQRRMPSPGAIRTALTRFPRLAQEALRELHLPEADFEWLAERWLADVQHALRLVLGPHKPLPRLPALIAAVAWAGFPTDPPTFRADSTRRS